MVLAQDTISFFLHTLSYIVSPAVLESAVAHGISKSGIRDVELIHSVMDAMRVNGDKRKQGEEREVSKKRKGDDDSAAVVDHAVDKKKARVEPLPPVVVPSEEPPLLLGIILNSRQVNSRIMNSSSLSELMRHVRENRQSLEYICASAAVSKGSKLMNKRSQSDVNDFLELVEIARGYLPHMEARNLSNLIHSLAKTGQRKDNLIQEILSYSGTKLQEFVPQNIANTIWALATLKYASGSSFVKELLKKSKAKLKDFNAQALANTIWALATLNYQDGSAFIKQLMREAKSKLREFKPQELANTAWALAVLDHSEAPTFLTSFLRLAYETADGFANENKRQFLHYLLLMEDRGHVTAEIKVDPQYIKFRRMCESAESNERTSEAQLEVFEVIRQLPGCSDASYEHLTEDGLFRTDIALQLSGGQKLAIEVDGSTHFLSDGMTLNGNTVLRNRLLENRGWKVISIYNWKLSWNKAEKEAYLKEKLGPYISQEKKRKREGSLISDDSSKPPKKKKTRTTQRSDETQSLKLRDKRLKTAKKKKKIKG